jgi:hypothetical protein
MPPLDKRTHTKRSAPEEPRAARQHAPRAKPSAVPANPPADDWSELSKRDLAEIDAAYDEADRDFRAGRCTSARGFLAELRRGG